MSRSVNYAWSRVTHLPSMSSIHSFKKSVFSVYCVLRHCAMYQGYEAIIYGHCPHGTYSLMGKTNTNNLKL